MGQDKELMSSINQMKARIRNQSKTNISECLKALDKSVFEYNVFSDDEKNYLTKIRDLTLEIEQLINDKHPAVDM